MDQNTLAQERIARQQIEEARLARSVTYLSPLQKKTLLKAAKGDYDHPNNGVMYNTPEGSALNSLGCLGLVQLVFTKGGLGGRLTEKGHLLLYENPKLKFPVSDNTRWIVSTVISILAILIALGSLIVAMLALLR